MLSCGTSVYLRFIFRNASKFSKPDRLLMHALHQVKYQCYIIFKVGQCCLNQLTCHILRGTFPNIYHLGLLYCTTFRPMQALYMIKCQYNDDYGNLMCIKHMLQSVLGCQYSLMQAYMHLLQHMPINLPYMIVWHNFERCNRLCVSNKIPQLFNTRYNQNTL